MNRQLHGERIVRAHTATASPAALGGSADGAFVCFDTTPAVVIGDQLAEWTRDGLPSSRSTADAGMADVITAPSTVAALRAGYPASR